MNQRINGPAIFGFLCLIWSTTGPVCIPAEAQASEAESILKKLSGSKGICAVLGDRKAELTLQLARKSEFIFYIQLRSGADVLAAREAADAAGFYGSRIYVEQGDPSRIHLADNLADAVVALPDASDVPESEVRRVVNPTGVAVVGDQVITKPFPKGVEDWTHPLHGPDNNPQSWDRLARAPYRTQFLARPNYAPMPQFTVTSAGRVFKAFGHIAPQRPIAPWVNKLVAFNGYNGTILWKRDLTPGFIRNTFIATPKVLYVGDDKSCKRIDTATGALKGEIVVDAQVAGGTAWKWAGMGMKDGVLYAIVGPSEKEVKTDIGSRMGYAWPGHRGWGTLYDGDSYTLFAIEPESGEVLWTYREETPFDGQATCMSNGRIYLLRWGAYLTCVNAKDGKVRWRKTRESTPEMFKVLDHKIHNGKPYQHVSEYLICNDRTVYFGSILGELLAIAAEDGEIMWKTERSPQIKVDPRAYFRYLLRDDGLYGFCYPQGQRSQKLDLLTGRVLGSLPALSGNGCTLPTGSIDSIFSRLHGGSAGRFDLSANRWENLLPRRPSCNDGVTVAHGHLYYWPMVCRCPVMSSVACLAPRGAEGNNVPAAPGPARLEKGPQYGKTPAPLEMTPEDWPTYRHDNARSATTPVRVSKQVRRLWEYKPQTPNQPTAPVTAGGLVFVGDSDGGIRALDAQTGELRWKAYTGGALQYPPALWDGRALVGSGDGWAYAFEAATGRLLWRRRLAPHERKIPVFGSLLSTWPVAGGVLVEKGVAYAAAGNDELDGALMCALDATSGETRWQLNHPPGDRSRTMVSGVKGGLLFHNGRVYVAGGRSIPIYDAAAGRLLSTQGEQKGVDLNLLGDRVARSGPNLYEDPDSPSFQITGVFFQAWVGDGRAIWIPPDDSTSVYGAKVLNPPKEKNIWTKTNPKPDWQIKAAGKRALAVAPNAVLITFARTIAQQLPGSDPGGYQVVAFDPEDGKPLWEQPLPAEPEHWSLAVDRAGRVIVTLRNGSVVCFGESQ